MQTVRHHYQNVHRIFDDIEQIYFIMSKKISLRSDTLITPPFTLDNSFKKLIGLFLDNGRDRFWMFYDKLYKPLDLPERDEKNIIVCFSGGKDSIATVLYYMEQGYNVYLYHMKHINFALTDEYKRVEALSVYWNLPLYIDEIKLSGHHDYVEHPMKNMIIANGALNYGIREGIGTQIAFGNYKTSTLENDNFEYCGGDCVEMWEAYEHIIQRIIPNFHIMLCLDNLNDTLETVCKDDTLLNMSVSCIGRANLRKHKHDWVKKKYGIDLPTHRCDQCYKCCVEYIYMTDHDLQEYSEEYYKYCMKKLKKNVDAEDGSDYSMKEVWEHYFFYAISESKYFS